ncbi:MAG: hypothetical protein A3B89_01425 [Candidatus Buchananbacteria bacterium RIFCSPHIGHO2_02_FULL_40_13]|uniref:SH3b domain-containing protein n=1 Tax=Candidatus Buchananbacteria bacterium RIFCSPLOWO2_01_FULL_39_33 TaxID=1797543 RepID=A0A1G1YLI3_9BACT|nr:MAG: hypothetical protein A2820_03580 [Candidatus Buchananbacteria bacterium RIFCSPHIGHO2_01_FULL_40_35]OGY50148.1 MAG: hypothetical protein A3B89_01425 [Candidatus Buchananbacteria bacterium RIFCSPHIGHO2_02_FULL_40_13]OGY53131.1 MAG: hypothetical protein A3A02_00240 [Candidatus Buchananbacteria bacterium RIFCSPLOWO2_01_FULL_39_33]
MVSQRKVKKNTATILPARVKAIKEYKTTHQKRFNLPFISNFGLAAEKDYLIENLSMLLLSGLDLLSSLDAIQSDIRSKKLKDIVSDLKGNIDAGFSLSQSLIESKLFPEHIISLIRIGEETGKLADNLKVIVIQQQKERSFRSKVNSAMMYPVLVLVLTGVIGIGISWFILPRLASVFNQLRLDLPFLTKVLIATGKFIEVYGFIFFPISILFLLLIIYFVFIFYKTKFIGQYLLFKIPGVGKLIQQVQMAQLGYILGTLLKAGLPIVNSISSLAEATTFYNYKKFFYFLQKSLENGNSIYRTFGLYKNSDKLITIPVQQMIGSAEKSGCLPETLLKIGEIFEEKTEISTKNLAIILEPVLLIIIWLGVVAVALAVILPIYSLIGGLSQSSSTSTPLPPSPIIEIEEIAEQPLATTTENIISLKKLKIKPTPVGYLNVRDNPNLNGRILLRIYPDEIYEYQSEQAGWYEIILPSAATGWVFGDYVELINQ